jgi:hypothetical protein
MAHDSKDNQTTPGGDREKIETEAEKNRRKLDEIPPPGTDPLHEGP